MHHQGLQNHRTSGQQDRSDIHHLTWSRIYWGTSHIYVLFCVSMCVKEVKMEDVEVFHLKRKLTTLTQQCQSTIIPHFHLPSPLKLKPLFSGFVTSTWKSGWICGTSHPFIGICESEDFGVAFYTQHRDTRSAKVMVKRKMMLKVDGETQILRPRHQISMGWNNPHK